MRLVPEITDDPDWPALLRKARVIIDELSPQMQTVLARHALGPQKFPQGLTETTVFALRLRHLLKLVGIYTAQFTAATELGRIVIVAILADEADRLVETELIEQEAAFDEERRRLCEEESVP